MLCPSFPKDGGRDTISLDGHHIQRVRGTAQGGLMGVHDGDAVVLTGELVGQAEALFPLPTMMISKTQHILEKIYGKKQRI